MPQATEPIPGYNGKDLLTIYTEATEKQRAAMAVMQACAETRSQVVRRLADDGMPQLAIAVLLDLSQTNVWRLLHRKLSD